MRPLIIIPTYNERQNIAPLVDQLLRRADIHVLIVDDGSPDGTGAEADRLARDTGGRVMVLHRTGKRGLGRSYVDGMREALRGNFTHVCQMDADFSHDPADLPRLIDATANSDLAVGSRYVAGGELRNWPRRRLMLSAFANAYVRSITRLPVRDCTSGFKCWRRELLGRLPLDQIQSDGYAFQVELLWAAHRAGARIEEIPITFVERRQGTSKMSGGVILESAWLPWKLIASK